MLYICTLTEDGQWKGLRSTTDEAYADQLFDFYCDQYPNAYLDILTHEEFHGGKAKWEQMTIAN